MTAHRHLKPHQVISSPLLTEKYAPVVVAGCQKVSFNVADWANKVQIKAAIEQLYESKKIKVQSFNTSRARGSARRTARGWTAAKEWKRAIVTLKPGSTLDLV